MTGRGLVILLAIALASIPAFAAEPPDAELHVIAETPHGVPYVGERVDLRVRGRFDLSIALDELVAPQSKDFDWIQVERDKWVPTNGLEKLYERHLVLFPRRSGQIVIPPFVEKLTVLDEHGLRTTKEIASEPVALEVSAPPADRHDWLPADDVELVDEWSADPASLEKGATVERTVTLRVKGADPNLIPPLPQFRALWLISFAEPEERTLERTPQGPVAIVRRRWSLRPATGEIGILPAIQIPWFDRGARRDRLAVIAPRQIGYAGFTAAARQSWTPEFPLSPSLQGAFFAGLLFATGILWIDARPIQRAGLAGLHRKLARTFSEPGLVALTLARRRRNAAEMRRALLRRLSSKPGKTRDRLALARLEEHFFAKDGDAASFDFRYW